MSAEERGATGGLATGADPVVPPVPDPEPDAAEARPSWRGPMLVLVLCGAGAGLVLLSVGRPWVNATAVLGSIPLPVAATGRDLSGLPSALGILALAGALAVLAARRIGRLITGVVLAAAGVGVVAKAVSVLSDLAAAVKPQATSVAGQTGVPVIDSRATVWIWMTVVGGLVVAAGGVVTLVRSRLWPQMSARYELPRKRSGGAPREYAARPVGPREIWSALDRGEDPTAGE